MDLKTKEDIFDNFWKPLICNENGEFIKEALINELSDFYFIMQHVPNVYAHATGGLLSKVMYKAEDVIRHINDNVNAIVRNRVEDGLSDMVGDDVIDEDVAKAIKDNYDKYI